MKDLSVVQYYSKFHKIVLSTDHQNQNEKYFHMKVLLCGFFVSCLKVLPTTGKANVDGNVDCT